MTITLSPLISITIPYPKDRVEQESPSLLPLWNHVNISPDMLPLSDIFPDSPLLSHPHVRCSGRLLANLDYWDSTPPARPSRIPRSCQEEAISEGGPATSHQHHREHRCASPVPCPGITAVDARRLRTDDMLMGCLGCRKAGSAAWMAGSSCTVCDGFQIILNSMTLSLPRAL